MDSKKEKKMKRIYSRLKFYYIRKRLYNNILKDGRKRKLGKLKKHKTEMKYGLNEGIVEKQEANCGRHEGFEPQRP